MKSEFIHFHSFWPPTYFWGPPSFIFCGPSIFMFLTVHFMSFLTAQFHPVGPSTFPSTPNWLKISITCLISKMVPFLDLNLLITDFNIFFVEILLLFYSLFISVEQKAEQAYFWKWRRMKYLRALKIFLILVVIKMMRDLNRSDCGCEMNDNHFWISSIFIIFWHSHPLLNRMTPVDLFISPRMTPNSPSYWQNDLSDIR